MLHHYLQVSFIEVGPGTWNCTFFILWDYGNVQVKNGEALPPGPLPRAQQPPHTSSKKPAGGGETGREEAEQKALLAVQCSLLKILSKTLATLQHFTPDCCQILLDQVCWSLSDDLNSGCSTQ